MNGDESSCAIGERKCLPTDFVDRDYAPEQAACRGRAERHDRMLTVTITWDHRAFEAATAGRILARLEAVLNGPIADELRALKHQENQL